MFDVKKLATAVIFTSMLFTGSSVVYAMDDDDPNMKAALALSLKEPQAAVTEDAQFEEMLRTAEKRSFQEAYFSPEEQVEEEYGARLSSLYMESMKAQAELIQLIKEKGYMSFYAQPCLQLGLRLEKLENASNWLKLESEYPSQPRDSAYYLRRTNLTDEFSSFVEGVKIMSQRISSRRPMKDIVSEVANLAKSKGYTEARGVNYLTRLLEKEAKTISQFDAWANRAVAMLQSLHIDSKSDVNANKKQLGQALMDFLNEVNPGFRLRLLEELGHS
jgi:hypothetical protein